MQHHRDPSKGSGQIESLPGYGKLGSSIFKTTSIYGRFEYFSASSKHHGPVPGPIHTHTHSFVKLSTKLLRKQLLVINSKFKYTPKSMKTQQKDLKKFATGGLPNIVIKCHKWYLIPTVYSPKCFLVEEELDFLKGIRNHQWTTLTPNDWVSAYKVHGLASVRHFTGSPGSNRVINYSIQHF